jgi:hypothetical protein
MSVGGRTVGSRSVDSRTVGSRSVDIRSVGSISETKRLWLRGLLQGKWLNHVEVYPR